MTNFGLDDYGGRTQERLYLSERYRYTRRDALYKLSVDRWTKERPKKLKPLVSNTQTIALNSISLAISNECDLLNWISILYDRMYCNRIRSPVYGAKNAHRVTAHFRKTVSFQRTWNRYRNSITGDFSHVIRRAEESIRPLVSKRIGFHSVHENRSANCCIFLMNSKYSHFSQKWFYYWFSPHPPSFSSGINFTNMKGLFTCL